ncbi:torsin-1A-interacting protein 2-like [Mya arenaria]|uniref:torsin-1A-interacting protein 2-like n=1 Tax=Mya arenaria TaxID=6604 RepID=UPI0022E140E6|nr:torsin-1A-interacting protein 2-like [Mya arenaria]
MSDSESEDPFIQKSYDLRNTVRSRFTRPPLPEFKARMPPKSKTSASPKSPRQGRNVKTKQKRAKKNNLYPDLDDDAGIRETETESETEDASVDNTGEEEDNVDGANMKRDDLNRLDEESRPYVRPNNRNESRKRAERNMKGNKVDQNDSASAKGSGMGQLLLWMGVLCVIVGVYLVVENRNKGVFSDEVVQPPVDFYKMYKPKFEAIRRKYPSQSTRFWKVIGSAIKRLINVPLSTYPAVIILAVPEGSTKVGTCLAKELVTNLNSIFNHTDPAYIDALSLNSVSAEKMKLDMDKRLISVLSDSRGVVIDHIESLKPQAALLFHGYCDGDNAPYKDAAFILVLHTSTSEHGIRDAKVEEILTELWGRDLGIDEMPALLSRIANSVAVLLPEQNVNCEL